MSGISEQPYNWKADAAAFSLAGFHVTPKTTDQPDGGTR